MFCFYNIICSEVNCWHVDSPVLALVFVSWASTVESATLCQYGNIPLKEENQQFLEVLCCIEVEQSPFELGLCYIKMVI